MVRNVVHSMLSVSELGWSRPTTTHGLNPFPNPTLLLLLLRLSSSSPLSIIHSPSAAGWVHNPYTNTLRMTSSTVAPPLHLKSRCQPYPGSQIKRFPVPDDKVDWSKVWPQYLPVQHTDPNVASRPTWADPDLG